MSILEEQSWDLESVFSGGLTGPAFQAVLGDFRASVEALLVEADALSEPAADPERWDRVIGRLAELQDRLHQAWTFVVCHAAADTISPQSARAEAQMSGLATRLQRAWTHPTQVLARCPEADFLALAARPALQVHRGLLTHARSQAPVLLPPGEQSLYDELSDDALHAWGNLYRRETGQMRMRLGDEELSSAQVRNRMESPDRPTRLLAFDAYEEAWGGVGEACANMLGRIVGVRNTLHGRLRVDELAIPLVNQRMRRETLLALRQACVDSRPLMARYLAARARLEGLRGLHWADLLAPMGDAALSVSWAESRTLVVEQLGLFSEDMAQFADRAFQQRWVESADRPGKRAGAFCAGLPLSRESRVFMTFGGGPNSVRTLAHELGHAYHNHVLWDLPTGDRRVPSSLAETASTFAESLVRHAMLVQAPDRRTRLALIDRELADAATFLLNIPVRFDFERRLFAMRQRGPLRAEELSQAMDGIQEEWYGPSLARRFPLFWAEKLHFYLTGSPFYNFPYTFGYLFSAMVHQRALDEGPAWAGTWRELLRGTGSEGTEDLARRFLGVDLGRPEAWRAPIERLLPLVEELEAAAG